MPRRNRSTHVRNGRQTHDHEQHEDSRKVSTEQMARNLVERGLASEYILDPSKDKR
jgi:hypothetical protein